MTTLSPLDVRQVLLEEISACLPKNPTDGSLQQTNVLNRVKQRLSIVSDINLEQTVLAQWYGLFATGYLSWGHNLSNSNPPFCHVTPHGKAALQSLSRDPSNPSGYLKYVHSVSDLNPIADSYLTEGLYCYVGGHYKAAAVMLGACSESIVLDIRDCLVSRLEELKQPVPKNLLDWRTKTVLDELQSFVEARKSTLPRDVRDEFFSYWLAFTQQIRAVRNDAGHPSSVDPVSLESAHASFLVFPLLAKVASRLRRWLSELE
jgi:hypothetical protein